VKTPSELGISLSSCRESNPSQKAVWAAETLNLTTRNDAKQCELTCGHVRGVDGINTPAGLDGLYRPMVRPVSG
jgi:hypothetical protein